MLNVARLFPALCCFIAISACSDSGITEPKESGDPNGMETVTSVRGEFAAVPGIGKEAGGFATLHVESDGMVSLDFSASFHVTNGPGLFVILSNADFPSSDALNLGEFKNPMGSQMYDVPSGVDITTYSYVLIHCIPYNVTFATAQFR